MKKNELLNHLQAIASAINPDYRVFIAEAEPKQHMDTMVNIIIRSACELSGYPKMILLGRDRSEDIRNWRHAVRWFLRHETNLPYEMIADITNASNHATIIHSVRTHSTCLEVGYPRIQQIHALLSAEIKKKHQGITNP